jgi:hypothetical protein
LNLLLLLLLLLLQLHGCGWLGVREEERRLEVVELVAVLSRSAAATTLVTRVAAIAATRTAVFDAATAAAKFAEAEKGDQRHNNGHNDPNTGSE